jgi:hypothetical protein
MQVNRKTQLISSLVVLLLSVACGSQLSSTAAQGDEVDDLDSLVNRLQANSVKVEVTGTVSQPFFTPRGRVIAVDGQDVQVFEYDSVVDADAESDLVSLDGSSVGASIMAWIATPHFYQSGKLIALYVGDQSSTIDILEAVLGPQIAGG